MPLNTQIPQHIRKLAQISDRARSLTGRLKPASKGGKRAAQKSVAQPLPTDALDIPVCDISLEQAERSALEQRGQFLARQDMWEELGQEIRDYDRSRAVTAGGMSKADLLALGARSDVTAPVLAAFADPALMPQHAPRHGLRDLEIVLEDHPGDYGVALVVINAYIDIAWAWRGEGWISDLPPPAAARIRNPDAAGGGNPRPLQPVRT